MSSPWWPHPWWANAIPVPAGWDYRCWSPAHAGRCLTGLHPATHREAVKQAARIALDDLGLDAAPGRWGPAEIDLALDTARALASAADAATEFAEKHTDDGLWDHQ